MEFLFRTKKYIVISKIFIGAYLYMIWYIGYGPYSLLLNWILMINMPFRSTFFFDRIQQSCIIIIFLFLRKLN